MPDRILDIAALKTLGIYGGDLDTALSTRGILPSAVPFNTAIPLNGVFVMAPQAVTSNTVFTPQATKKLGASCYVRLISNGSQIPTFSGMAEHGSSSGWNGSVGFVNLVTFWYDGVQTLYSISQTVSGAAAAVISSVINNYQTPNTITLGFTAPISSAIVPNKSAFAIINSGGTDNVTTVAIVGGAVILTKSRATVAGDTMTITYNAPNDNGLIDNNGNVVTSFVGNAVSYQAAPPPATPLNFTTLIGIAKSGNATAGYTYTRNDGNNTYAERAVGFGGYTLPANQDGFIQCTINAVSQGTTDNVIIGFADIAAPTDGYTQTHIALYQRLGGGYQPFFNHSNYGSPSAAAAVDDVIRVRREGSIGYFEVSKDGGATFSTSAQVPNMSTGALYPLIQMGSADCKAVNLRGSSNLV